MSITARKDEVLKRFTSFDSWEDRYRQLIHYGKKIATMNSEEKADELLVPGCLSKVWLKHELRDGKIFFKADSDAAITKGIIGVLISVYSDSTPEEITSLSPDFLKEIGITDHLSMNRRNGLANMCKLIQGYGEKYAQT